MNKFLFKVPHNKNLVPILSYEEIDALASLVLNEVNPDLIELIMETPLELIIETIY